MVMTLYKVEVRPPPGVDAESVFAERFEAGPAIRRPIEGDRFRVRDAWGRDLSGVIVSVEDLGIGDGADLLGAETAQDLKAGQLRVVRLVIEQRRPL